MVRPAGLFDIFDNLDQISIEAIASNLKPVPQLTALENYLANRILYPQTMAQTQYDMKVDLAILREALKINGPRQPQKNNALLGGNPFLNTTLRKILIPAHFLDYVPNLAVLTEVFTEAFLINRKKEDWFSDVWAVAVTDGSEEVVGTVLLPQFNNMQAAMNLRLGNKNYQLKAGNLIQIPCPKDRCEIAYKLQNGQCLGKQESAIEVYGGKLGIIVMGRQS
ncbi:hypothetical protein HYS95_00150 [Candidatus Daviesbacteria bacterium]|nr:hypothetical protein [Candidatus Daviesbacteria bacterium]